MNRNLQGDSAAISTIGWIPYWNLAPLRSELRRRLGQQVNGNQQAPIIFRDGHPTQVNRWLAEGEVLIAPSSSVCLLKNGGQELALPYGIACNGAVQSVYLSVPAKYQDVTQLIKERCAALREIFSYALYRFPDDIREASHYVWQTAAELPYEEFTRFAPPVRLSPHSSASVALTQLLYRLIFGRQAFDNHFSVEGRAANGDHARAEALELLIGDEALERRCEFSRVIDLGQVWQQMTGLPFVFAVWQKNGKPVNSCIRKAIAEACEFAEMKMHIEPQTYLPTTIPMDRQGREIDLASYWRGMHYKLQAKDMQGLLLFLCLVKHATAPQVDEGLVAKLLRWQELAAVHNFL